MIAQVFIKLLLLRVVTSQINGEFWWLNKKLVKLQNMESSAPTFDNTNEFDTDESVKITFRDNELYSNEPLINSFDKHNKLLEDSTALPASIDFQDHSKLSKTDVESNIHKIEDDKSQIKENTSGNKSDNLTNEGFEDVFEFTFPITEDFIEKKEPNRKKHLNITNNNVKLPPDNIIKHILWPETQNELVDTENICTFKTKRECIQSKGVVHKPHDLSCSKHNVRDSQVCCILPLPTNFLSKIIFPDSILRKDRSKRGVRIENTSSAMKQRNALMNRKFVSQAAKLQPVASTMETKVTQKIVTPEDYTDPYWNIKNSKFRYPYQQNNAYQDTKYDYGTQDYGDYVAELPKPGLIGLYSDLGPRQTTWKLTNKNKGFTYGVTDDGSNEDNGNNESFGYSTFDPRLGSRVSTATPRPIRRKPISMMTSPSGNVMVTSESQTIKFNSNPDFHVMEGFKLLNFGSTKNRFTRTSTQSDIEEDEVENEPCESSSNVNMDDLIDLEQQVFKKCGKSVNNLNADGVASKGFDPWLALVIHTKSQQDILCYATIVHPRIAVTAADCVHGMSPGEVSVRTGMSEVNEDRPNRQQRLCTTHTHPEYSFGDLENDLAILHWKRPLRMETTVQPACLAEPHVGDECYFVGWGGYDKAMEKQSRRQRATILSPKKCRERISKPDITLPQDAFCASVTERGTVTGVGGPLLCRDGEHMSMVGVAVWREDVVVLLPPYQWLSSTMPDILPM